MHWGLGPNFAIRKYNKHVMSRTEVFDALKYRVEVDRDGTRRYLNGDGIPHRVDGPAIEKPDGTKEWWCNGKRHRIGGPAVVYADGAMCWWINGVELSKFEFEQAVGSHDN